MDNSVHGRVQDDLISEVKKLENMYRVESSISKLLVSRLSEARTVLAKSCSSLKEIGECITELYNENDDGKKQDLFLKVMGEVDFMRAVINLAIM